MRSLILIVTTYVAICKILIKNPLKSMRSLILIMTAYM